MADENVFTLDGFRKAADQKFGALEIDLGGGKKTVLQSPLRIASDKREVVLRLVEEFSQEGDEEKEQSLDELNVLAPKFTEFLLAVGDKHTTVLLDEIGDDLAVLLEIFNAYQEKVGLGEA